jgi:O-methyltransferase domain
MNLSLTMRERLLRRLHLLPFPVMDVFGSVLFGRALAIAVRRGVFEALSGGPRTVEEIAVITGLDHHALLLILEAGTIGGYTISRKGRFSLTRAGRQWMLRDSPASLTSLVGYVETLHQRWSDLETSLERGRPVQPYYASFDSDDWTLYVNAMGDLARFIIPLVIPRMAISRQAHSLLDIGGSHGLYALACCKEAPALHATVLDLPGAIPQAQRLADRETDLHGRVRFLAGDILATPFPGGQDIILLFNVVHGLLPEQNEEVIRRAIGALGRGGRLFILEQCFEGERESDLARFLPLMVGLNLLSEIGGRVYDAEQILRWCSPARRARRIHLLPPGLTLIEAGK